MRERESRGVARNFSQGDFRIVCGAWGDALQKACSEPLANYFFLNLSLYQMTSCTSIVSKLLQEGRSRVALQSGTSLENPTAEVAMG